VLFNEPKLLKWVRSRAWVVLCECFSALQRAEIAEIVAALMLCGAKMSVSVLFNEPKLLKFSAAVTL